MKTCWALVLVMIFGCALSAFASSPDLGVLDPSCPITGNNAPPPGTQFFDVIGSSSGVIFPNFSSNFNGGGLLMFCNDSSSKTGTWEQVAFVTANFLGSQADGTFLFTSSGGPVGAPIDCSPDHAFLQCLVTITDSKIILDFSGIGGGVNGIQPNATMTVTLNDNFCVDTTDITCNNNKGQWLDANGNPITLAGGANVDPNTISVPTAVPEPTSLLLLASGIGATVLRKRKKTQL